MLLWSAGQGTGPLTTAVTTFQQRIANISITLTQTPLADSVRLKLSNSDDPHSPHILQLADHFFAPGVPVVLALDGAHALSASAGVLAVSSAPNDIVVAGLTCQRARCCIV